MINSPYWDKMAKFSWQIGRMFSAQDAASTTEIPYAKACAIIKHMAEIGMLKTLKKVNRAQFYKYNPHFDLGKHYQEHKRRAMASDMRINGDEYHQILSEVI